MISKAFEEKKTRSQKNLDIFNEAVKAGEDALNKCVPTPMVVEKHTNMLNDNSPVEKAWCVPDGVCGFAQINLAANTKENRAFLNDMKKFGFVGEYKAFSKGYTRGYQFWVSEGGQSMQKKEAYAHAFADTLRKYGITCYVQSRMD
jgi:hypothetical protein